MQRVLHRSFSTPPCPLLISSNFRGRILPYPHSARYTIWKPDNGEDSTTSSRTNAENEIKNALRARQIRYQQQQPLLRLERRHRSSQAAQHFGRILNAASDEPSNINVAEALWKTYCNAKRRVPNVLHALSDGAWDLLWQTQNTLAGERPTAKDHIGILLEDMESVGHRSTFTQRLTRLATLFDSGKIEEALALWEEEHDPNKSNSQDGLKAEHMELGACMHARAGNFESASKVVDDLYGHYPSHSTKVLMFVFNQYTASGSPEDCEKAYAMVEEQMKRTDRKKGVWEIRCLLTGYLRCKDVNRAIAALHDLFNARRNLQEENLDYHETSRILKPLLEICQSAEDANRVALEMILILPTAHHHLLFQLWLKRMLRFRDHESIAMSVELMYERGMKPDHRHMNILLEAFFRSGNDSLEEKAENLAWSMINKQNTGSAKPGSPSRVKAKEKTILPFFLRREIPPATMQTFVHLIRYYGITYEHSEVENVLHTMEKLQVAINIDVINALLFADLKRLDVQRLWNRYNSFTDQGTTGSWTPNGYTFVTLWKSLRIATFEEQNIPNLIPSPRSLLRETLRWFHGVGSTKQREIELERLEGGTTIEKAGKSFFSLVLRCFKHSRDLPGAFVALRALRSEMNLSLTKKSIQAVLEQLAWVNLPASADLSRRRRVHEEAYEYKLEFVTNMWHSLLKGKLQTLQNEGVATQQLSQEEQENVAVDVLCQTIGMTLMQKISREEFDDSIRKAEVEIGVKTQASR